MSQMKNEATNGFDCRVDGLVTKRGREDTDLPSDLQRDVADYRTKETAPG